MPNYEKALGYALEREKKLRAKVEALKRRAESAESNWQLAEAENKRLRKAIKYALSCGMMTETVCRKFEEALKP